MKTRYHDWPPETDPAAILAPAFRETGGEIDLLMDGASTPAAADPADDLSGYTLDGPAICQSGDVCELGRHRLICGDARRSETYERLLRGELAQMVVTDSRLEAF